MNNLDFGSKFLFGAATASYQIEGAWNDDGKGESIWDRFVRKKGTVRKGHKGDRACEHYFRYESDVELMKGLNLGAYRFSISWPRVMPSGVGTVNEKGLDFYERLVDCLLESGIEPYATLYHWDMPYDLFRETGGFLSRECSHRFADYTEVVVNRLGDRIKHWMTLNEPWEHAAFGYFFGSHAPGRKRPWSYLKVIHHQLLAHGYAMERIRSIAPDAKAGIVVSLTPIHPESPSDKDQEAALIANQFMNRITLDPLYNGHYPKELWQRFRWFRPKIEAGDFEVISTPTDFLGINTYSREKAGYSRFVPLLKAWIRDTEPPEAAFVRDGVQYTSMGWEVYPECISEAINLVRDEYGNPPMIITENGAAFDDVVESDRVHDDQRISFLAAYLGEIKGSIDQGANVKGYFVWSLLDNFEWSHGYDKRFGLIYVDYNTKKRIIKDSGHWYRDLIISNQASVVDN